MAATCYRRHVVDARRPCQLKAKPVRDDRCRRRSARPGECCACHATHSRPSCLLGAAALRRQTACRGRSTSLSSGRFAHFATGADVLSWICLACGHARRRARVRGGSAPTFADSLAVWYRVSPGDCRFTASGRRTRRRPRKCSNTASSIRRAARCSTAPGRGRAAEWRWRRAPTFVLVATERADVARLDERRGRRATRATARTSSASSTNSTASAAGWRRK
jgi:hypothetical protein